MAQSPWDQPDIGYYPNFAQYELRSQRRARHETLETQIPPGCPTEIHSETVWGASIIDSPERWLFRLKTEQIDEICDALQNFKALNLPLSHVRRETFVLPKYGKILRAYSRQLHDGLGFFFVRGFPVDAFSREDQVIIFAGLASYIGDTRARQDQSGAAVSHVTDLTQVHQAAVGNPAFTAGPQAMHTDPGPIIGMLCLNTAADGGESVVASSVVVYNQIARQKPHLIKTLIKPWCFDGYGGDPPYTERPLMFLAPSGETSPRSTYTPSSSPSSSPKSSAPSISSSGPRLIMQFVRRAFTGFRDVPRTASIPPITEAQAEALDAVHFIGLENAIKVPFEKGDFQFLNNLALLHAREGFRDGSGHKRHLLRMWLRDSEYGWDIPHALSQTKQWQRLWDLDMEEQWFPLEPVVKSERFTSQGAK